MSFVSRSNLRSLLPLTRSIHTTNTRVTRDPLLSSPDAKHYVLPDGTQFIVRTPPSAIPKTLEMTPLPPPSPLAPLTHPLGSPSLKDPELSEAGYLPPLARPQRVKAHEKKPLGPKAKTLLRQLRKADPQFWTLRKSAEVFNTTSYIVSIVAPTEPAEKARKEQERQEGWDRLTWRKKVAIEERMKRRSAW